MKKNGKKEKNREQPNAGSPGRGPAGASAPAPPFSGREAAGKSGKPRKIFFAGLGTAPGACRLCCV